MPALLRGPSTAAPKRGAQRAERRAVRGILAGTFAVVALLVAIGWMSLSNLRSMDLAQRRLVEQGSAQLIEISQIATSFQRLRVASRDLLAENSEAETSLFVGEIAALSADVRATTAAFGARADLAPEVRAAHQRVAAVLHTYFLQLDKIESLGRTGHEREAGKFLHSAEYNAVIQEVITAIDDLKVRQVRWILQTEEQNRALAEASLLRVATAASLAVLGTLLGGFRFLRVTRQTERARYLLQESEKRFRLISTATSDVLWDWDLLTDNVWWNENFQRLFGYSAGEVRHDIQAWSARIHPDDAHRVEHDIAHVIATVSSSWAAEYRFRRHDGTYASIFDRGEVLRDDSGSAIRMVGVMMDITERKQAETELLAAKTTAEAANRAKSEFLANMSHEIRTPMNGIIGMTELLLDMDMTSDQVECLAMVKSSADSLLTVINDILDFSKIEAGKLEFEAIEFDLRDALDDAMRTMGWRADQKGIELACFVPPEVPQSLIGDPSRLRQVVLNLVGNAIKFTEQGEIVVRCEIENDAEGHSQPQDITLHFQVTDSGIGIAREQQELVFSAFTQADNSMTRKYGGTGLGLTISARLVEMMGGRIWVESEPGKGSTFHFTARAGIASARPRASACPVNLVDLPVLVVDDNATNRRILHDTLSQWHMRPTEVASGLGALALLAGSSAAQGFPLILVDAQMPEMDGFTLIQRIKQMRELDHSTIMMLSSAGMRGDAARCRELGVSAYLTKPIKQKELLSAILTVLGKREGRQSLTTRHSLRERSRPLRILLAEDNVVNQKVATRLLARQGHAVIVALNGEEAVALAAREPFDLVLMDIQMPVMDGFEATKAIRRAEKATGKHVPIVALTAHAMKGDEERCLAAGMDRYLSKPVQAKELHAAIAALTTPAKMPFAAKPETPVKPQAKQKRSSPKPAQPASRAEPVLDHAALDRSLDGDAELLKELVAIFQADSPQHLARISAAIVAADATALRDSAHALKGAVSNFYCGAAAEAALRLERMGRDGAFTASEAQAAFSALRGELARLLAELESTVQQPTNGRGDLFAADERGPR
ncbi:MAG: response regulator [Candidatus Koribacter versatilis]|uniref:Sensory/regulatory protein RpfC n=1 Tax=Candidatus Korobacter versatilis TaxID=658062 RepID=A0A932A6J1_9BACT|nr:response regulator [Candidatus Koribacter versatilis]